MMQNQSGKDCDIIAGALRGERKTGSSRPIQMSSGRICYLRKIDEWERRLA
jgi:hypothetical protein